MPSVADAPGSRGYLPPTGARVAAREVGGGRPGLQPPGPTRKEKPVALGPHSCKTHGCSELLNLSAKCEVAEV